MIPEKDININPNKLYNKLENIMEEKINTEIDEKNKLILNNFKSYILDNIKNKKFWNLYIISEKVCDYENKHSNICGRNR